MKQDTLFLHMGPGSNAYTERVTLGSKMENVHFWDQPHVETPEQGFQFLIKAAEDELLRMNADTQQPIHIMAHCFGVRLAQQLLHKHPEKIGRCQFINSSFHIPRGFLKLLNVMTKSSEIDPQLKEDIKSYLKLRTSPEASNQEVWEYLNLIARDPLYIKYYWPKSSQFNSFIKIAMSGPAFDATSFQVVLDDFLNHYSHKEMIHNGNHEIMFQLGGQSPLIDLEYEQMSWKNQFPKANFEVNPEAGHFMHLEGSL